MRAALRTSLGGCLCFPFPQQPWPEAPLPLTSSIYSFLDSKSAPHHRGPGCSGSLFTGSSILSFEVQTGLADHPHPESLVLPSAFFPHTSPDSASIATLIMAHRR